MEIKTRGGKRPWYKSLVCIVLVLFVWVSVSAYVFFVSTNEQEVADIEQTLKAVANINARSVELIFSHYTNFLQLAAQYLANANVENSYYEVILNELVNMESFHKAVLVLPPEKGMCFESDGTGLSQTAYAYIPQMDSGEVFVSDVFTDEQTQTQVVAIHVPVVNTQGEQTAYLIGLLSIPTLSQTLNETQYDIGGYYYVIDASGNYIALSNAENMLADDDRFHEVMMRLSYEEGYQAEDILTAFSDRSQGITKYYAGESSRVAYYTPVSINNWIMFSAVDRDIIEQSVARNITTALWFIAVVTIAFVVLLLYLRKAQKEVLTQAREQERQFHFVSEQINQFLIELDLDTMQIRYIGNFQDHFNRCAATTKLSDDLESGYVHPEDIAGIQGGIAQVMQGENVSDLHLRLQNKEQQYIWCSITAIPVDYHPGRPLRKAIGLLKNIDEQVHQAAALQQRAETDLLTGLYNKVTTESRIADIVSRAKVEQERHILYIIDIDNFKTINDTFGHKYGDDVIVEFARTIQTMFRPDDIVGRVGGDEFFAFLRDVESDTLMRERGEMLCRALRKTYRQDGKQATVSASIGIAAYPTHGTDFEALYKHADLALYAAKQNGKDNFAVYAGQTAIDYVSNRTAIDSEQQEVPAQ